MKKLFTVVMVLAGILFVSPAYSVDIVKDGKSGWRIVVAPQAFPITVRAAEDLQLYIKKSTGAMLPIERTAAISGEHHIIVGDCDAAVKAGIDTASMKPEGFVIKTVDGNFYIVGKDDDSDRRVGSPQAGTWHGVSTFLEQFLDVRWFFPGEQGEYVPQRKDLSIGVVNIEDFPKMELRQLSTVYWEGMTEKRRKEVTDWRRRNKEGRSVSWNGSHSWVQYFRGEDYYKDHPDWFAEVNGRRVADNGEYGLQMCTTNPQALDKFAEIIIEKSKESGGRMFTLSPNDSSNHCECKNCCALDVEKFPDGSPVMTDRYMTYCNEIAKRVNKVLPDQTFGMYAYSFYMAPPRKTKIDPHVKIMHVLNDFGLLYYSDKISQDYLNQMLIPWKKMVGSLYYYSYPEGMGNLALPCMHPGAIKKLYADLNKAGITGYAINNSETTAASALNNYLGLKMAWDPGADVGAIYTDALEKCYGPKAAPYAKQYFDVLEKRTASFPDVVEIDNALGTAVRFPNLLNDVYDGLYEEGMPFLKQASAVEADNNQKFRLQLVIDNLEYCRDTMELYTLSNKIMSSDVKDKKDVQRAIDITKKRAAYLEKLRAMELLGRGGIEADEKTYNLPFSPSAYQVILNELENGKKETDAVLLKGKDTPAIDGKLNEPFWEKIAPLNANLDKNLGEPFPVSTLAKVAYDSDYLYVGVHCEEPRMDNVKGVIAEHDGPVWIEDELEFFLDDDNVQKDYKHILINTLGTVTDLAVVDGKEDTAWESGTQVSVSKCNQSWSMELRIPLKAISSAKLKAGDAWKFNVCRLRTAGKDREYTCWSPTFGGFAKPERFGKLNFH